MTQAVKKTGEFLASYGLSCILFVLLLLLTYLGTLYQVEHGLYEAQKKYFESFLLIHDAFGVVPVILPGTYLLLILLFVNLILGAVVRHTGSALAIPDFPLAFGRLIPPLDESPVVIHFIHRLGALVVTLCLIWLIVAIRKHRDGHVRLV